LRQESYGAARALPVGLATSGGAGREELPSRAGWRGVASAPMSLPALELRPGTVISYQGRMCQVTAWEILRNDRRQFVKMKVRDVLTGRLSELKENSDSKFDVLDKEEKELSHSYRDGLDEVFFTPEGEEIRCPVHAAEDALQWEADSYTGFYIDGQLVSVSAPRMCVATVQQCEPPMKNAGTGMKDALLDNGVTIKVSQIVDVGDRVRIDTESMEFKERV
jgi:elongation factor P